ncbi:hypothetical protein KEM54_001801 [Ascosphaera aggregata]|nr:hypothetical protein KEM54_001801 [Ascosphaera aggregata]
MKILRGVMLIGLFGLLQVVIASNWAGQTGTVDDHHRWQEIELRRWLADHDIPHPPDLSQEELEQLVRDNWQQKIAAPASRAKDYAVDSLGDAKQWVFDTWDETTIKQFLDSHGITESSPSDRNSLLQTAKDNYDAVAEKVGETVRYPGDWLYAQWSESQLKEYLDKHGYKVPQHTKRDQLVAAVRRAGFLASKKYGQKYSQASSAAKSATESISDAALQKWSDADFMSFFEQHGIHVPSGYSRGEIMDLVEKYRHLFTENAQESISSVRSFVADKTKGAAQVTETVKNKADKKFEEASKLWSNMRLKEFLASRQVEVRAKVSRDELLKLVYENRDKVASAFGTWMFDTWNEENLRNYLAATQHKAADSVAQTRDQLVHQARAAFEKASRTSGADWSATTDYISSKARNAMDVTLHGWSRADIEDYLKSFGILMAPSYSLEDVRAEAQKHARYFKYGVQAERMKGEIYNQIELAMGWIWDLAKKAAFAGRRQANEDVNTVRRRIEANIRHVADEL